MPWLTWPLILVRDKFKRRLLNSILVEETWVSKTLKKCIWQHSRESVRHNLRL
ncbi:hypothetical protein OROGR_001454 [Orobanche gracilis]